MRWGVLKDHKKGNTRIIIKFLWFPLTLQGQTRWLEMAKIKQWCNMYAYNFQWENIEWADDAHFIDSDGRDVNAVSNYKSFDKNYDTKYGKSYE